METINAKDFLSNYARLEQEKRFYISILSNIDDELITIGGTSYGDRVQSSPKNDPIGEIVVQLEDRKAKMGLKLTEIRAQQLVIENLIASISAENNKWYMLLAYKYLMGASWREICSQLKVSRTEANRMHSKALEYFEKNILAK